LSFAFHIPTHQRMHKHNLDIAFARSIRSIKRSMGTKIGAAMPIFLILALFISLSKIAASQVLSYAEESPSMLASTIPGQSAPTYLRPTEKEKVRGYVFDTVGPYAIFDAGFAAGVNQLSNTPPEWLQGTEGFGKRFASNFSIDVTSTTTRYALSEALRDDTLYYLCECQGALPRLRHAALATLTARHGPDGHQVFSFPALIAPYAGSMTAVYGWYPDRYGAKDAFRMGNYIMLIYVGGNVAREFLYGRPHSLFSRMHRSKTHGAPLSGPTN